MQMNAHSHDAKSAIDTAIADLTKLRARIFPSSTRNVQAQAESCQGYAEYTREAFRIGSDLTVKLAEIAVALGDQHLTKSDRDLLRCTDNLNDVLVDAEDWASEILNEYEAA